MAESKVKSKPKSKTYAKVAQLYAGLDLIGSKTSVHSRDAVIEVTAHGLTVTSKKTKRIILIPYSNIKGIELIPQVEEESDTE